MKQIKEIHSLERMFISTSIICISIFAGMTGFGSYAHANIFNQSLSTTSSCSWVLKPKYQLKGTLTASIGSNRANVLKMDAIPGLKDKFLVHVDNQLNIAEISRNSAKLDPLISHLYRSFNSVANGNTKLIHELVGIDQKHGLIIYKSGRVALLDIVNRQVKNDWQLDDPLLNPIVITRDKKYLISLNRSTKQLSRIELMTGNQLDLKLQISRNAKLGAAQTPTQILAQFQSPFDILTETSDDPQSLYMTVNGGWDLYRIDKGTAAITPIRLAARPKQDPLRFHKPLNGPVLIASTSHSLQNRDELEIVEQAIDPALPLKSSIIKYTDIGYFTEQIALIPRSPTLVVGTVSSGLLLVDLHSRSVVEKNAFQSPNYAFLPQIVGDSSLISFDVNWSKSQVEIYLYEP